MALYIIEQNFTLTLSARITGALWEERPVLCLKYNLENYCPFKTHCTIKVI